METTDAPTVEVHSLPALDVEAVRKRAHAWLERIVASAEGDSEKLLTLFVSEDAAAVKAAAECDAVVHTLLTGNYRLRRGAKLADALGTNRSGVQKIKERAAKNAPEPVADPVAVLPKVARVAKEHSIRKRISQDVRNAAVNDLLAQGWSSAAVGRLIGRDASRVSHIKNREEVAA